MAATGSAVVGRWRSPPPPWPHHRLPAFMVAVLPLVALGAFEVVVPAADAVARMADHTEAATRLAAVEDLPVPVHDPDVADPLPSGTDIDLGAAVLRYRPDGPRALDGLDLHVPAAAASRWWVRAARQEQHRQRRPPVLGPGVG